MPTYEYRREDGSTFEVIQRFSDAPLEVCPETGQKVRRVIAGGAGLIFKGSGFYLTDYVRNGNGKSAGKEESTGPKAGSKSDNKSDSTSESKTAGPTADKS